MSTKTRIFIRAHAEGHIADVWRDTSLIFSKEPLQSLNSAYNDTAAFGKISSPTLQHNGKLRSLATVAKAVAMQRPWVRCKWTQNVEEVTTRQTFFKAILRMRMSVCTSSLVSCTSFLLSFILCSFVCQSDSFPPALLGDFECLFFFITIGDWVRALRLKTLTTSLRWMRKLVQVPASHTLRDQS